ncbi:MAG: alkaline phosphatase family protein [Sulfolobaceae archaeon]
MNRREFLKIASLVLGSSILSATVSIKTFREYFTNYTTDSSNNSIQKVIDSGDIGYYFLIYVDGLSPVFIEKFNPPNIMNIISEGTYFPNAYVGHLTSNTIVSHAVGNAGLFPSRWGIVDYGWRNIYDDPDLNQIVPEYKAVNPGDYSLIVNYDLPSKIRRHYEYDLPSFPLWLKSTFQDALTVGISTKQYMATYLANMDIRIMGKTTQDGYIVPYYQLGKADGLVNDVTIKSSDLLTMGDNWVIKVVERILENLRPRYMLINLPDVDLNAHINGGPGSLDSMYQPVMNADKVIGELINKLKTLGIYDKSLIVITADHGFSTNYDYIDPNQISNDLANKGINTDLVRGASGYLTIWLSNPDFKDNDKKRTAANYLKENIPNVIAVFYKARFNVGGNIIENYVPVKDDGRSNYVQLLKTMLCEQGPDIIVFFGDEMSAYPSYKGNHGGAGWLVQNIPIIIRGPNVPKGMVVETLPYSGPRLVDIAPTLVSLTNSNDKYLSEFDGKPIFKI